ncbi:MAG TPA: L,D-transpeptidase [Polyangiaceae bacterium]|nr:L,D-transpeptidase [Polyangiaceae bacterium]
MARLPLSATPVLVAALAVALAACKGNSWLSRDDPTAMRVKPENGGIVPAKGDWSHVPVPPADGPQLAPITLQAPIYAKPDPKAEVVGYLRLGAKAARSAAPVTKDGCPEGWYAVRPLGFACVGANATVKLDHPLVRAIDVEPDRSRPMPYPYAFVRAIAPSYMKVPTNDEQFQYEMRLERHLRNHTRLKEKWDELDVGANDVPLDERGIAIGGIPDHAKPLGEAERFGGKGDDKVPWWLEGGRKIPNISSFKVPSYAVISNRLKRHAGVSLIGTFVAGAESQNRRFAISTDARLIPADKLKADSGSPFHGYEIKKIGLPVAFARKEGVKSYRLENGRLVDGDKIVGRSLIALTGGVKELRGERMVETRDGAWVPSADIKTAVKSSKLPGWARGDSKWIDVSIQNQVLVLYEGAQPVYVTLVSTGRDGLGEPGKTLSTPTGQFRIYQKHITTTMDSDVADHEFELRDVPWVMYFKAGYALHAAYWHDDFGRARSHGCINLAPIDARYVFFWSSPQVPEHWHGAYSGQGGFEEGTLVYVHP